MTPDGKIVISVAAGHGGLNRGSKSRDGRLVEAEYALSVADLVAFELLDDPLIKCVRVRTEPLNLTNDEEAGAAWRAGADAAVSIHVNSYPDPSHGGTLALHRPGDQRSRELALCLLDAFRDGRETRCALADSRYPGAVAVLGPYRMPAAVFEIGFASNDTDVRWMLLNKLEIAKKIAEGLRAWAKETR